MLKRKLKSALGKNTPSLQDLQFHIDVVSAEAISGWAFNNLEPQKAAKVEVFSGDELLWEDNADHARSDLVDAGLGDCAFNITPDIAVLKNDIESVDILINGHKVNPEPVGLELTSLKAEDYICHFDAVSHNEVLGWARNIHADTKRVTVELKHEDKVLAFGLADQPRVDLADAGIGDGNYGFTLKVNAANFPSTSVECQVYLDGLATLLNPVELNTTQEAIDKAKFVEVFSEQIDSFEQLLTAESQRIANQIVEATPVNEQASLNTVVNVAINNIAEISTRLSVIEKVLTKHFSK
ncbi:hypothetical protein M0C34_07345 [Agarivorans sp. TSD2052]|uniref:hypothetical protein n=1 Tax=Agarivorans sp. TSD2052 TaxID=2937286 RepID=UPI00200BD6BF|nr:hypothetical protein [Agarivorans sp. TSD2052]UPW20069.1 hypothetical protein M0C34_07345 [Agarivorans sp. TSD2052]